MGSLLLKDMYVIKLILMSIAIGEVTIPSALGVSGIWIAIPFSAILFVLMFKILKDRYE